MLSDSPAIILNHRNYTHTLVTAGNQSQLHNGHVDYIYLKLFLQLLQCSEQLKLTVSKNRCPEKVEFWEEVKNNL